MGTTEAAEIPRLVQRFDTSLAAERRAAWALAKVQIAKDPVRVLSAMLDAFPTFRTWQGRTWLLFYAVRYAQTIEHAFQLGVLGCQDRSTRVRYRGCGLLAYSLREDALQHLKPLLAHQDKRTSNDAAAAIDAIESRNHHYFLDRRHSGRVFWIVNQDDKPSRPKSPW